MSEREINKHWWKLKDKEAAEALFTCLGRLKEDLEQREQAWQNWLGLYESRKVSGLRRGFITAPTRSNIFDGGKYDGLSLNVTASCVDTEVAKICSQKPLPMVLADDGDWEVKNKAKKLGKFLGGVFYDSNVFEELREAHYDRRIFGLGAMKVFASYGKVKVERVFPLEILVDEKSCPTADPRVLHHVQLLDADVLCELYPDNEEEIRNAIKSAAIINDEDGTVHFEEQVEVAESWHLRSGPKASDGKHIIAVSGCTLLMDDYKRDEFPFLFLRKKRRIGWYGQSQVERGEGLQMEINKLARRIQDAMHMYSVCNTYVRPGVKREQFKNVSGNVIVVPDGVEYPKTDMPSSVSSEVFNHLRMLREIYFEEQGISQLSASAKKPAGLESGIAIQNVLDEQSERLGSEQEEHEQAVVKLADHIIAVAKEIGAGYKVKWRSRDYIETIDWSEVDMERDSFTIQVWPANILPRTPAGRLDAVDKMIQRGMVGPGEGLSLLDFPDVAKFQSLSAAAIDDLDRVIEHMLVKGEYVPPSPYQDLQLGMRRVLSALLRARCDGCPEDKLENLENWLDDANEMLQKAATPAPSAPPMGAELPTPPMQAPPPMAPPPELTGPAPGPDMMPPMM